MSQNLSRRDLLKVIGAGGTVPTATTFAGCSASGSSPSVTMQDFAFQPRRLEVAPGTTVEWTNDSAVPHTVTAYETELPENAEYFASGGFESERAARNDIGGGLLEAGASYTHTFGVEGMYRYFCIPHESSGMVAEIVVE